MKGRYETTATLIHALNSDQELTERCPLKPEDSSNFCSKYGRYILNGTGAGGLLGTGAGTALSIFMLIKPELFDSWNLGLAIYTCLFAPLAGAASGSSLGATATIAFFGVKHLFTGKQDCGNDIEKGYTYSLQASG